MQKWVLGTAAVVVLATACQGERLSRECRQQVVQLCGMTRSREVIGTCLREKQAELSDNCRSEIKQRIKARGGGKQLREAAPGAVEISYGSDAKQRFDFWPAPRGAAKPGLVVFIHGGGWSIGDKASGTGTKPVFYNGLGYAFASLNYRLVPDVTVDQQAGDIAAALATLRRDAGKLGFAADNIVVMGHSAGAHLAALVASDTSYFEKAGVPVKSVKGTILLDGAGYDVAKQMEGKKNRIQRSFYEPAFGNDPNFHRAMSPITHVGAPNAPQWLILFSDSRDTAREQSQAFGEALKASGEWVDVQAVPDSTHMSVNNDAGVADSFVGKAIAGFLKG